MGSTAQEYVLHSTKNDVILTEATFAGEAMQKTGFGYLRIKRSDLIYVLLNAVQKEQIPIHYEKRVVSINDQSNNITAVFSDGTHDIADILLGCDGIYSDIRSLYIDSSIQPKYSGISAMFSILKRSQLSNNAPSIIHSNSTFTTNGVLTVMPCTALNDEVSWFFSREIPIPDSGEDGWKEYRQKEVQECKNSILDILQQVQGQWGNFVQDLICRSDKISFTPLYMIPLGKTWSRGRCLLLGDAAHAVQPHAGQGASMAIEDAFVLSHVIKQNPNHSIEDVFLKYDNIRRPRITRISTSAERNGQLWRKTGPWGLWFKQFMAWLVFTLPRFLGWKRGILSTQDLTYDPEAESYHIAKCP